LARRCLDGLAKTGVRFERVYSPAPLALPVDGAKSGVNHRLSLTGQASLGSVSYAAADDAFLQNRWAPLRSLITADWNYIRITVPAVYDLRTDFTEQRMISREATGIQLPAREHHLRAGVSSAEQRPFRQESCPSRILFPTCPT
jgi:arylsulfatase A-like enzyme